MSDDTPENTPKSQSGYFMLAHRDAALSHDTGRIMEYKAAIKHALLFNRTLVIADHMVVNSPNFRICYHTDQDFRDIICSEFVELAHFDKYTNGPHITLQELREFYTRMEGSTHRIFHHNLPDMFKTGEFDRELNRVQESVVRRYPPSELRDPLFTKLILENMENDFLKDSLGKKYPSYEAAFNEMRSEIMGGKFPVFGIIHFDHEHSSSDDRGIFEYWAEHEAKITREPAKTLTKTLIKRFGAPVAQAHRALLVSAETQVLNARAVLSPDLKDYRRLVLASSQNSGMLKGESQEIEFEIELSSSRAALAFLTFEQIRECRKMGEDYFSALDTLDGLKSGDHFAASLRTYIRSLSAYLEKLPISNVERPSGLRGIVKVVYGTTMDDELRRGGLAVIVTISAWGVHTLTHVMQTAVAIVGGVAALKADPRLKSLIKSEIEKQESPFEELKARIINLPAVGSLIQYDN